MKLDCKLKTHDVVEIITNPQATPSRDWLNFVKTSQAKAKIKQWFKKANREENIVRGKEMLADAARRQGQKLGRPYEGRIVQTSVETLLHERNG